MPRTKLKRAHAHKPRTLKQIIETRRDDQARREAELYGDLLNDVRYLRGRGWVITREAGGFRVGNTLCDATEVRAKAAREREMTGGKA